ncbi:MAG TPA: class I SAM-dependent methyltransferase [Hyphomicrobium sp.]|nr:class I SAM-dependent methyltransferase [Hyphomicrobium sp.]
MTSDAANIIALYERHARTWDAGRSRSLFEQDWLRRFLAELPPGAPILDIGCGSGEPIAGYFVRAGFSVHGVDSSPAMIELCKTRFPQSTWNVADMRRLSLGRTFAGILAWNSFLHLQPDEQRQMFSIFRKHAAPGAALMFTSGPREGVAMGTFGGEPLYHASLDPAEYEALLDAAGFNVVANVLEDPATAGHTIWLARSK